MEDYSDLEVGDKVWCDGNSGFCHLSVEEVIGTSFKYDEDTGVKYKVIHLDEDRLFDCRDGSAITPPMAYYISRYEEGESN